MTSKPVHHNIRNNISYETNHPLTLLTVLLLSPLAALHTTNAAAQCFPESPSGGPVAANPKRNCLSLITQSLFLASFCSVHRRVC